MAKKREFTGVYIDNKCRICLKDDGCMSDIFSEDIKPKIYTLGDSTSVHINDDKHSPRNICHVCLYKLDMWIEFKEQFLRSNAMLREHLELSELSDNAATAGKRKHGDSEEKAEADSIEHGVAKKMKTAQSTEITCENRLEKNLENSETKPIEDTLSKNNSDESKPVEKSIASENQSSSTRVVSSVKQTTSRRVKTTDKREASTKRWVARKKALLAATGKNETDTDSESSDEAQLSSVRKTRKSSAEIAADNQRISKTRKSTESGNEEKPNTKETIVVSDLREKSEETVKILVGSLDKKNVSSPLGKESVDKKNAITDESKKIISRTPSEDPSKNFVPQSVRSELIVDEATFIVTSTLVLAEPRHLSPVNSLDKSSKNLPLAGLEESSQERNTDIIDAVQLRRVCPKSQPQVGKKFIERCLNIEVEGSELETLQRVQAELANFVETKLMKALEPGKNETIKPSYRSLDQQVKEIVERSIKKNVETSRMDRPSPVTRGKNTFTSEFVRAAMRSRIFQPRVLLVRCEDDRNGTSKKNNRTSDAIATPAKRRSIKPARYADYDGFAVNTPSEESKDVPSKPELVTDRKTDEIKTYAPALTKQRPASSSSNNPRGQENVPEKPKDKVSERSVVTSNSDTNPSQSIKSTANDQNIRANIVPNKAPVEKHICGICGDSFGTRKEVEIHFSDHKSPATITRQVKPKMMRCKRCHEIVEARYVKLHVCKSIKNNYKCYICEATFRSEKILVKHLETHGLEEKPKIEALESTEIEKKPEPPAISREPSKAKTILAKKRSIPQLTGQTSDTYTCFVCDKTFEEEDVLKDHLQKHCDDMSEEEEPSDDREQYQCAICGETMESEDALESHVEKHLFDDEDDNPNLISIGARDRTKNNQEMIHGCTECSEKFDSEMLLMLHMQAHEEEVAIAEWERRRVDNSAEEQHICVICDQLFASEAELSEHLDIHNGNAHVCLLCDKPFLTLEELQAHVNTH